MPQILHHLSFVFCSDISFCLSSISLSSFFFFNDTATTEIYTLSLHDALPISHLRRRYRPSGRGGNQTISLASRLGDRKSTRLNSSHVRISYAVFCLKKKKKEEASTLIQHILVTTTCDVSCMHHSDLWYGQTRG